MNAGTMRRLLALLLTGTLLALAACTKLPSLSTLGSTVTALGSDVLTGTVHLSTQATATDVSSGATVSLIDTSDGHSVAATVTKPDGTFSLDIKGWKYQSNTPYVLEAVKGLPAGGTPNRVGAAAARLRTLLRYNGGWGSLTAGTIDISPATTALCTIQSLKALSTAQQLAAMGTVNGASYTGTVGATGISSAEFTSVIGQVNAALLLDQDPMRCIARDVNSGAFVRLERGALVTDLSITQGYRGDTVVLYGSGFDRTTNLVRFNGTLATGTGNPTGTEVTVTIPATAIGGPLTVQTGNLISLALPNFTVLGLGVTSGSPITTVAGRLLPSPGTPAANWNYNYLAGIAVDAANNIYVSEEQNHSVWKIDAAGIVSHVAGIGVAGSAGGNGSAAASTELNQPHGLTVDATGSLYITDTNNNRILKVTNGIVTTVAAGALNNPYDVKADAAGNLYIADWKNHRIQKVTPGGVVSTVAGTGTAGAAVENVPASGAPLNFPRYVALDATGSLYISDNSNNRVRMVPAVSGTYFGQAMTANNIYTIAGGGASSLENVLATTASVGPNGLEVDAAGNLYIAIYGLHKVRKVDVATGKINTIFGTGNSLAGTDGVAATAAQAPYPYALTFDKSGNLLVAEYAIPRLRIIPKVGGDYYGKTGLTAGFAYTISGHDWRYASGADGSSALDAQLYGGTGIGLDAAKTLYFVDTYMIRSVANGVINRVVGTGLFGGAPSGTVATLGGTDVRGMAVDAAGNLYFTHTFYKLAMVPKNDGTYFGQAMTGGRMYIISGTGSSAYGGDNGPATSGGFVNPQEVAVDATGSVYVSDTGNHRIRMIPAVSGTYFGKAMTANNIYTVVGTGLAGAGGDNGAVTSATINSPRGLTLDAAGNLYFADCGNHKVRKVTSDGIIRTIAGSGPAGSTGDGLAGTFARLNTPTGVAVDSLGFVYIADSLNHRIRKVDTTGIIYTLAGSSAGYAGDGLTGASAKFNNPLSVAVDASGSLYVMDRDNRRIRRLDP